MLPRFCDAQRRPALSCNALGPTAKDTEDKARTSPATPVGCCANVRKSRRGFVPLHFFPLLDGHATLAGPGAPSITGSCRHSRRRFPAELREVLLPSGSCRELYAPLQFIRPNPGFHPRPCPRNPPAASPGIEGMGRCCYRSKRLCIRTGSRGTNP